MFLKSIAIFITSYNVLYIDSVFGDFVDVDTTSGLVRGQTIEVLSQTVNQFLGIPFAQPPIGRLRFAKTQPLENRLPGIIDATLPKSACMQLTTNLLLPQSEDCLVLNIWSSQEDSTSLKPVMFWIHGGGPVGTIFDFPTHNGSILATNGVIVVSNQYRLGPFGNLYGGSDDAPGNLALYDQRQALLWVKDNIHLFGGDKDRITMFAQSAGSFDLSAHILSPLSRGLFRRAILQSGADFHNKFRGVSNPVDALAQAKTMAGVFLCWFGNWLDCLRNIPAPLLNAYPGYLLSFFPLDRTEFVPEFAQDAFEQQLYDKGIDLMAGVTQDDGSIFYALFPPMRIPLQTEPQFNIYVEIANQIFHDVDGNRVRQFYLDPVNKLNSSAVLHAFIDFFGDLSLKCSTYNFAKHFAANTQNRNAYFYELTHRAEISPCDPNEGVCHGADLDFVFGKPIMIGSSSQVDIDFSHEVMNMWTNFAKTGNPGENWPRLTAQSPIRVKNLNPFDSNSVLVDPFKNTCDGFWKDYFN